MRQQQYYLVSALYFPQQGLEFLEIHLKMIIYVCVCMHMYMYKYIIYISTAQNTRPALITRGLWLFLSFLSKLRTVLEQSAKKSCPAAVQGSAQVFVNSCIIAGKCLQFRISSDDHSMFLTIRIYNNTDTLEVHLNGSYVHASISIKDLKDIPPEYKHHHTK